MKLYGYWRSSCTWRVRIALELKGLSYEVVPVHLIKDGGQQRAEGFRKLNPLAQVPVLEVEDDGIQHLSQSLPIIEYLDERFPDPRLLPGTARHRARIRQLAEMVNAGTQPLQNLGVLGQLSEVGAGEHKKAWAQHFIATGLAALEQASRQSAGAFLVGDAPTLADLCLVPQLYNARRFDCELSAYPTLLSVESACEALDAFQKAHPDVQPDAERS